MKRIFLSILVGIIGIVGIMVVLIYFGVLRFNLPLLIQYPVKGVDVSHYQGDIDWEVLAKEPIYFAMIKATEGSSYQDETFRYNYEQAQKTDLYIGAYHFFSFDSSGKEQAENYIHTVPVIENSLPPIIDFEFYGDKKQNPPNKEVVRKELNELITQLEEVYHKRPIIYATESTYEIYLKGDYEDYPLWIRSLLFEPKEINWTLWQYANWGRLKGYSGGEVRIDLNVFNGSEEEFIDQLVTSR